MVLDEWPRNVPTLSAPWIDFIAAYPSAWRKEQRLMAVDGAVFKANPLHPRLPAA